jgi:hypothetical protein
MAPGEQASPRREGRRHVEHRLLAGDELLRQEVAETAGALHGPDPVWPALGPAQEPFEHGLGRSHPQLCEHATRRIERDGAALNKGQIQDRLATRVGSRVIVGRVRVIRADWPCRATQSGGHHGDRRLGARLQTTCAESHAARCGRGDHADAGRQTVGRGRQVAFFTWAAALSLVFGLLFVGTPVASRNI